MGSGILQAELIGVDLIGQGVWPGKPANTDQARQQQSQARFQPAEQLAAALNGHFEFVASPDGLLVTFKQTSYFDFDKSKPKDASQRELAAFAAILQRAGCVTQALSITGHADPFGTPIYNKPLSRRRALAVAGALSDAGVGNPMLTEGKGSEQPVVPLAPSSTHQQQAPNRRVVVKVNMPVPPELVAKYGHHGDMKYF